MDMPSMVKMVDKLASDVIKREQKKLNMLAAFMQKR